MASHPTKLQKRTRACATRTRRGRTMRRLPWRCKRSAPLASAADSAGSARRCTSAATRCARRRSRARPTRARRSGRRSCARASSGSACWRRSTVADWLSGGRPEDGLDAGREAWQIFGQLAAQRAAVAARGHQALSVLARLRQRRAARQRAPARRPQGGARAGARDGAGDARRDAGEDVRGVRVRAPAHRRGARAAPGGAGVHGHARPAHGAAEPHADHGPRRADGRALAPPPEPRGGAVDRHRRLQGASTTRSGAPSATRSCRRSRAGSTACCAAPTGWRASAATSSW